MAAAIPTTGLSAVAAEPDPIFAAIAACRDAEKISDQVYARVRDLRRQAQQRFGSTEEQRGIARAYIESLIGDKDEYTDGPAIAMWDSYDAFAQTLPATLAAMLVYAGEIEDREPNVLREMLAFPTLATAAKTLVGRQQ